MEENPDLTNEVCNLPKFSKLRIVKNLVCISTSFLLFFMSYDGLSMLQSSMNKNQGVGVLSLAMTYLFFGIASLLLPKYVIKKIGCKTAIYVGMIMYIPWEASNYYPHFFTMIPSAALIGIGASLLWGAQCTYFNESCFLYWKLCSEAVFENKKKPFHSSCDAVNENIHDSTVHNIIDKADETILNNINAISTSYIVDDKENVVQVDSLNTEDIIAHSISYINCNVISENYGNHEYQNKIQDDFIDLKLSPKLKNYGSVSEAQKAESHKAEGTQKALKLESVNAMFFGLHGFIYLLTNCLGNLMSYFILRQGQTYKNITTDGNCYCGAQFCNDLSCFTSETMAETPITLRYTFTSVCIIFAFLGILLIYFGVDPLGDKEPNTKFTLNILFASLKHARKKEQLFLIPLSFYVGMEQGFFISDFTRSYITCTLGTYIVGLVTMTYGLTCAIASSFAGLLVKLIGRIPVFVIGLAVNVCTCSLLLLWVPDPELKYIFFICSALYGIFTGIFWSQVIAFYGVLFKEDEEAAFGFHFLCLSLGSTLSYAYNDYICSYVKIYMLCTVMVLGITGYFACERIHYMRKKRES